MFNNELVTWDQAQTKCRNEGLQTPTKTDDVAIRLRKYILDTFGMYHLISMLYLITAVNDISL